MADVALLFLWAVPGIVGLLLYATVSFRLIDVLFTPIHSWVEKRALRPAILKGTIGGFATRFRFWLPHMSSWIVKTVVGLPMLHVVQLIMSKDPEDIESLAALSSGLDWQAAVFQQLPKQTWMPLIVESQGKHWVQIAIIATFLLYTFWYSVCGFDLVRRTFKTADVILSQAADARASRDLPHILAVLHARGWTGVQCGAASWFLIRVNYRIMTANPVYKEMKPQLYAVFRVFRQMAVAVGLSVLTPVVAGLYVGLELRGGRRVLRTAAAFSTHFGELPADVQTEVCSAFS